MACKKEEIFINKLLASLKLNNCDVIDISEENVRTFMPMLQKCAKDYYVIPVTSEDYEDDDIVDEENLVFNDFEDSCLKFYEIINSLDPLLAERQDDKLNIILDKKMAILIIGNLNNEFPNTEILKLGKIMKKFMSSDNKGQKRLEKVI